MRVSTAHAAQEATTDAVPAETLADSPTSESDTAEPGYTPGNREDFDRLYRASYQRVVFTLTAVLRSPAAAEDCAQEAYVRAFARWNSWRPDAPAEAWIHRIALNVAISYRRHQRLREVGEVIKRFGVPPPPPDPAVAATDPLMGALRKLPRKQAAILVLRHLHGYTNREIGAAMGISESTVASRLAAAKQNLRRDLAPSLWAGADPARPGISDSATAGMDTLVPSGVCIDVQGDGETT